MKSNAAPRVTNPRRLIFFGVVALGLTLALLFSARSLIREMIVLPLSYLFWSIGVFVDTTPQLFFWAALLLMAGLTAYRSLVGRGKQLAETPPELDGAQHSNVLQGQAAHWSTKVNLMRQGQSKYFQNSFHQSVGKLLMETLSYRYHLTPNQIEEQLRDGSMRVPEEVRSYALSSLRPQEVQMGSVWSRYWSALVDLFRSWFAPPPPQPGMAADPYSPTSREEQQVLAVLKYIEDELEVPHDDTGL